MKKLLLFPLLLILFSSFVYATINEPVVYLDFQNNDFTDKTVNGFDATNDGTTNTSGINFDGREASGTAQGVLLANLTGNPYEAIMVWVNPDTQVGSGTHKAIYADSTGSTYLMLGLISGTCTGNEVITILTNGYKECWEDTQIPYLGVGVWHKVLVNWNSTAGGYQLWVNNTNYGRGQSTGGSPQIMVSTTFTGDGINLGNYLSGNDFDGKLDEFAVWNNSLNVGNITDLQTEFYPFITPPAPNVSNNESTEQTILAKQIGTVTLTGTAFTIIENITFNISTNNSPTYFSHVLEVAHASGGTRTMNCQVLVGGVLRADINRTLASGDIGNMYIVTENFTLDQGEHSEVLQCRKISSGGSQTIEKGICIGHVLVDQQNQTINNDFRSFTLGNLTSDYKLLEDYNFTVSNYTTFNGSLSSVIIDWNAEYVFNSTGNISTRISVGGVNCSETVMGGSSGESKIAGALCGKFNTSPNEIVNIKIYARDSGGVAIMNVNIKEILLDENEIVFDNNTLSGTVLSSSALTFIGAFPIQNTNHASSDIFGAIGLNIVSNSGATTFRFQSRLNGTAEQNTSIYLRTIDENAGGVVFQDLLEDAPIGNYTFNLFMSCDNADCTILGSNGFAYVTDTVAEVQNSFNVSVFDNFDNSGISNFSVDDGEAIFSTTTGSLLLFTSLASVNLTFSSGFSGGYFSNIILNHNTSNDLTHVMNQTLITWDCIEKVSENNLNCTAPTETTIFNYNVIGNEHTQSVNVSGYFENITSFNVTALQNNTLNATLYSTNQTFTTSVISGGGTPSTCNFTVTTTTHSSFNETVTGTSGTSFIGLINGTYNVSTDCTGYAINTTLFTVENITQTLDIPLFTTNSISITYYHAETGVLLNNTNITLQIIGTNKTTINTSNATIYIDLLSPSSYTLVSTSNGFRETQYIIDLVGRDTFNLNIFLQPTNTSSLVLISVTDKFSNFLQGAQVTIQRYINNSWQTEQILSTDFQGRTEGHFVVSTEFYNFLVEFEGTTFFGVINSDENKKAIFTEDVNNGIVVRIDLGTTDSIVNYQSTFGVTTSLSFVNTSNTSGYFRFSWDDSNNIPRNATVVVQLAGSTLCTDSTSSESGISTVCNVTQSSGSKIYTAYATIDGFETNRVSTYVGINTDLFINWGVFGFVIAFLSMIIFAFMFSNNPSMVIIVTSTIFTLLIMGKVIFSGMNLMIPTLILFVSWIVASIKSNTGVNT